jgi:hypothetical protein
MNLFVWCNNNCCKLTGHDDAAMDPCDNSNDSGLGIEHSSTDLSISPTSSSASLDVSVTLDHKIY